MLPGPGEKGGTELIDCERIAALTEELLHQDPDLKCYTATPVTNEQIEALQFRNNRSDNWKTIAVTTETDLDNIKNCTFEGEIHIHLPAGVLSGSTFNNCFIEGPLTVRSTQSIKGMTLLPGSTVEYCGVIEWNDIPGVMQANINAGLETGERAVPILPFFNHREVAFLGSAAGRDDADKYTRYREEIKNKLTGIIGRGSIVKNNSLIQNTLIQREAVIDNAGVVRGSILLPNSTAKDGAIVRNSVLQWTSKVDSGAIVENSIVGECALVERHGKLTDSFLGADSVLGEGEVTASLVGPLTGIHHQCLLIAAMWPGGLGNIGYGANIGSNHTSRLPDQEIRPGTGQFFGLSTSVKFPSDFSDSPFTIIATGLTTLPQKVSFPFSLISLPQKRPLNIPDGWCQIIPAWMLQHNLYSILRNIWKFKNRTKSIHTPVNTIVFTDEVLNQVKDAKERLEKNSHTTMPGIGKNYLTEEHRLEGIEAYRKCIRSVELWNKYQSNELNASETGEMLDLLHFARKAAIASRLKDYKRGGGIIEDYLEVRTPPEEDEFLKIFQSYCNEVSVDLKQLKNPKAES